MFSLLVAIALLEHFEALDPAIDVFDCDSVSCKTAVEGFLLLRKFTFSWLFEGRDAESVELVNALKPFVAKQKNICEQVNPALLEQFKVMNRSLGFGHANDLLGLTVDHDLIFDGVAFLLAGIALPLFFWGRSISCSVTSTTAMTT